MISKNIAVTVALLHATACLAVPAPPSSSQLKVLYQFPQRTPPTWLENMAQRPNGDLLLTNAREPELWSINTKSGDATLVKRFPLDPETAETRLMGIAEFDKDQYAIEYVGSLAAGTSPDDPVGGVPGHNGIYTIDMRSSERRTKYLPIPSASWLDGMTVAIRDDHHGKDSDRPKYSSVLLAGDTRRGGIYAVDPLTGKHQFSQPDPNMLPPDPNTGIGSNPGLGINGVRVVKGDQIYYTSNGAVYRFKFSTRDLFAGLSLKKIGPVIRVATVLLNNEVIDDIAVRDDGTVYVAGITRNTVYEISSGGSVSVFAGGLNDTSIPGPTACLFDQKDARKMYVSTNGGQIAHVNGIYVEPANVVVLTV